MFTRFALCCLALVFSGCDTNPQPMKRDPLRAEMVRLEADVRFLADDALEGREAGTRGYDLAALYVAERFRALGLRPGGDEGTYYQSVPMLESELGQSSSLRIADIELVLGEDYLVYPSLKGETIDISAPLVFGGMCFASERHERDDFEGLDLNGKIAVCMEGAPKFLNSEERAHFRSTKSQRASALGASGLITVQTPTGETAVPFERRRQQLSPGYSRMTWLDEDNVPFSAAPSIKVGAMLSLAGGEKLFESAGRSWSQIVEAAEREEGIVDGFELGLEARINVESQHRVLSSDNVVGILPGSDPVLAGEYVILMGHLDSLGINPSPEEDDDEINNGALDNAAGISALLEIARLLRESPPKRSIMFLAVTAEEKGLNGSDYFARNPTVPVDKMVAAVNVDMPIATYQFEDLIAFGVERSTMLPVVQQAVEDHGLKLSPDPLPEQGLFTRSDNYKLVQQGVPAISLVPGQAGTGAEEWQKVLANHYHKASDEVELVNFDALRRFTDVKADIARNIADMPERPVWNAGDFFGTTFNGPMAPN